MLSPSSHTSVPRKAGLLYLKAKRYIPFSVSSKPQRTVPPFCSPFSTVPPSKSTDCPTKKVTVSVICVFFEVSVAFAQAVCTPMGASATVNGMLAIVPMLARSST